MTQTPHLSCQLLPLSGASSESATLAVHAQAAAHQPDDGQGTLRSAGHAARQLRRRNVHVSRRQRCKGGLHTAARILWQPAAARGGDSLLEAEEQVEGRRWV